MDDQDSAENSSVLEVPVNIRPIAPVSYFDDDEFRILYNLTREQCTEYSTTLIQHIDNVKTAALHIVGTIPPDQIALHDLSKWSKEQYPYYARRFFGDGGVEHEWKAAWNNHLSREPHHWQHWMIPNSRTSADVIYMPACYSDEMVADWLGAGKSYQGSWNISKWLIENIPHIVLHERTQARVNAMLEGLGYQEIIHAYGFDWGVERL